MREVADYFAWIAIGLGVLVLLFAIAATFILMAEGLKILTRNIRNFRSTNNATPQTSVQAIRRTARAAFRGLNEWKPGILPRLITREHKHANAKP